MGSTPTLSANISGHGASGNTYPCQGQVAGSIPAARSIIIKPDLYPYSGSADAKTGWAALTGFADFLTQKNQHQFGKLGRVRFIATVLKTVGSKGSVSSNLTVSAIQHGPVLCVPTTQRSWHIRQGSSISAFSSMDRIRGFEPCDGSSILSGPANKKHQTLS